MRTGTRGRVSATWLTEKRELMARGGGAVIELTGWGLAVVALADERWVRRKIDG